MWVLSYPIFFLIRMSTFVKFVDDTKTGGAANILQHITNVQIELGFEIRVQKGQVQFLYT